MLTQKLNKSRSSDQEIGKGVFKKIAMLLFIFGLVQAHLFIFNEVKAQCWNEYIISTSANNAKSVYAIDVDGNGDTDVLSASSADNKIAWYENDGAQNFTEHSISTSANWASSVYAIDVDGDTDIDVLSASQDDDKIAWYKNDGNENFTEYSISTSADGAQSVYAIDMDGDGETDVLSASAFDNKIAWYENDGSQNFTEHSISDTAFAALDVYATDMDGDGDTDVLSASVGDNKIAWYENDGNQNFTEHLISDTANSAYSVYAIDVNGDGDIDALSASDGDDKIAWYENDGNQNFTEHLISDTAEGAQSVYATDVNGNGDIDVLSASFADNKIAWYSNDGSQNFTERLISETASAAFSVYATDVNGDANTDVLSASGGGEIAWYEKLSSTSSSIDPTACDSYTSPSGNTTWTSSGTYMDTIPNAAGCDSVITIDLTIKNSTSFTLSPTACDRYTFPSGNYTWTSSGTYMDTIPNQVGCDSILTINLTVDNSTTSTISPTVCDNFTAPSGNYIWDTTGTYLDTIPNTVGCDSIITIDLTIYLVDTPVTTDNITLTADATSATYQWLDCNNNFFSISGETSQSFTASENGNYAVEVTQDGCTDTSNCHNITGVRVSKTAGDVPFQLYPNPNTGSFTLAWEEPAESAKITITNVVGQTVYQHNTTGSQSVHEITLTVPRGVFLVQVKLDKETFMQRVVITE